MNLEQGNQKPLMWRRLAVLLHSYGPCPVPSGSAETRVEEVSVATRWQRDLVLVRRRPAELVAVSPEGRPALTSEIPPHLGARHPPAARNRMKSGGLRSRRLAGPLVALARGQAATAPRGAAPEPPTTLSATRSLHDQQGPRRAPRRPQDSPRGIAREALAVQAMSEAAGL